MRRSILVVMIDVMVLSVLALTAGQRSGGERNIPIPLYRWSSVIEEGLRKEQTFREEVKRLEEQLAKAAELAKQALTQADRARDDAGREREGTQAMQTRLHKMELAAEKARAAAELAKREAELAEKITAEAKRRAEESERRTAAAEKAAEEARLLTEELGVQAADAEKAALKAKQDALLARSEGERLRDAAKAAEAARLLAQQEVTTVDARARTLQAKLDERTEEFTELQVSEAAARERARAAEQERERLVSQGEQAVEKVVELAGQVAELEVRKEDAEETVAQLEEARQLEEAERKKSVWVRRDEALRRLNISYTEFNSRDDRNFITRRQLTMPLVQVGRVAVVPADFRKLGLGRSFFGGLSDYVTAVEGTVRPVTGSEESVSLEGIVVPGDEPQVCFVRFSGDLKGALRSISMESLKEQRLKNALLFSPDKMNEHGRVEIVPVIGSNYLTVRRSSGKRPKVGDYLLSDRGEFIGVMVTTKACYVTPQKLSAEPKPVVIPVSSTRMRDGVYFREFIERLNYARKLVDTHLKKRRF